MATRKKTRKTKRSTLRGRALPRMSRAAKMEMMEGIATRTFAGFAALKLCKKGACSFTVQPLKGQAHAACVDGSKIKRLTQGTTRKRAGQIYNHWPRQFERETGESRADSGQDWFKDLCGSRCAASAALGL